MHDYGNDYGNDEIAKSKMRIAGYQIHQDGCVKEFDLGEEANIIPNTIGENIYTYKCDYQYTGNKNTSLRGLLCGGSANSSNKAGLSYFYSALGVDFSDANVGYRLIKEID